MTDNPQHCLLGAAFEPDCCSIETASGVVYRDLKPDNFLFDTDEAPTSSLKAADFGLSSFIAEGEYLQSTCGTPMYIAPEVIAKKYNTKADIWSLGMFLHSVAALREAAYASGDPSSPQPPSAQQVLRCTLCSPGRFLSGAILCRRPSRAFEEVATTSTIQCGSRSLSTRKTVSREC